MIVNLGLWLTSLIVIYYYGRKFYLYIKNKFFIKKEKIPFKKNDYKL